MNDIEFKDPAVLEMCEVMIRHRQKFIDRRKGAEFKAILFTFAHCFPHDKPAIWEFFKGEATPKSLPETGGAKITRGVKKAATGGLVAGCKDCPSPAIINNQSEMKINDYVDKARRRLTPAQQKPAGVFDDKLLMIEQFAEPKNVVKAFEESAPAMLAFAHSQGITIPENVSRVETIAAYISRHFKSINNGTNDL